MSTGGTAAPPAVLEREMGGGLPALAHPAWSRAFPWLVQGTTTRGDDDTPFDLGLFSGGSSPDVVRGHLEALRAGTGMRRIVHAHQTHGHEVRTHRGGGSGLHLVDECDGHLTAEPGVLLVVTTADCVPVFVVAPERRAVGMVHAGWRGASAGVLESALDGLQRDLGTTPGELHVHLGPAICGGCYEVGPEVFAALGQRVPDGPEPIDLRRILAGRAVARGVPPEQVTVSAHCTRCTGSGLFSHRGGDLQRQVGFLGIRPDGGR